MSDPTEKEKPYLNDVDTLLADTHTEGRNSLSEDFTSMVMDNRAPIVVFKNGEPDPDAMNEFFGLLPDGIDDRKAVSRLYLKYHPLFRGASENGLRLFIDVAAENSVIKNEKELGQLRRRFRGIDSSQLYNDLELDIQAAKALQKGLWQRVSPTPPRQRR